VREVKSVEHSKVKSEELKVKSEKNN